MGLVSGEVGGKVEVICCCSLRIGDLGGFGLGGEGVLAERHGLKGKNLLDVGTGLWWARSDFLRVGGRDLYELNDV